MKNIVYARVDDRLVHGQVMTAWVLHTKASKVIIVDDKAAKDSFMKMIMKSAMPSSLELEVLSVSSARADRRKLYRNIAVNEEEMKSIKAMQSKGMDVYIRVVPDDKRIEIKDAV